MCLLSICHGQLRIHADPLPSCHRRAASVHRALRSRRRKPLPLGGGGLDNTITETNANAILRPRGPTLAPAVSMMIVDNSPYRKYAPFLRRRDEQKAQTYVKWIYQQ